MSETHLRQHIRLPSGLSVPNDHCCGPAGVSAHDLQGALQLTIAAGHFDQAVYAGRCGKGPLHAAMLPNEILELLDGRNRVDQALGTLGGRLFRDRCFLCHRR